MDMNHSLDNGKCAAASPDSLVDWSDAVATAKAIAPLVRAAGREAERLGTMTPEIVELFKTSKMFWLLAPEEVGGWGADILTSMAVIEELSRADASAGWSLMANVNVTGFVGGAGSEAVLDLMYRGDELPIMAGMFAPTGKAERVDGGYMMGGSYSFGSGSGHATWIGGGALGSGEDGPTELIYFVPREEVIFKGGWDVIGLIATGSYDYEIPRRYFEDDLVMYRAGGNIYRGQPTMYLDLPAIAAAGHAAVALGLGLQGLDELQLALASRRPRPGILAPAEQQLFQYQFSLLEGRFLSARSFCYEVFGAALDTANAGNTMSELQYRRLRQATTVATIAAREMVEFAFEWAGSQALRNGSVLGRTFRDMRAAAQHIYVDPSTLSGAADLVLSSYGAGNARR